MRAFRPIAYQRKKTRGEELLERRLQQEIQKNVLLILPQNSNFVEQWRSNL